ncbi:E3 ubiquitin-protein ligase listerin [Euphorbia lathyris]|uniref:E3 ubiquitin-protein ligase listerin n=1 Tax=Euphorbia lathyris TaxID=212925 RepID=UPI003313F619
MGRQKGERSKSRPSSSSLAAALLPSSSAAAVGFGGYVGSSRLDTSLSSEESSLFLDVDSEVALHLKRLARKDPTTKLKALQALSVLFKQKSGKDLVPIIPQWAFEYKRLLLDYNREVRRATHETMSCLVVAVGRDIAPHLKYLMGPWWFSQFDSVSEVSLAAKRSLQAAFPAQEKRLDALILCTTEIFMCLEENLKLTPQNMSDKGTAPDELEDIHQQVISSSLLALATLLDVLVPMQSERPGFENVAGESKHASKARTTAISFAENLFSAHKYFLDFLKSQSTAIRSATYSVLKSFIKNIPHTFDEGTMKTLAASILGAFQEKDPTCHSSMWEAILLFSKRFPESWTLLNVQKIVLNRFLHFLRNGCYGSQQVSYPALILFLSTVPSKSVTGEKFLLDFFSNLWDGRTLSHSITDDNLAFFQAFKECFLWGFRNASRYCDSSDSVHRFRVTLIESILVKLLWHEYLSFAGFKDQNGVPIEMSEDASVTSQRKIVESLNVKPSMIYSEELGKCTIEILSGIYSIEHDLLPTFCVAFQENCLQMFQKKEDIGSNIENVEQVIKFLSLLEQHSSQSGESWPLVYLVGPMLAKSLPFIKSLDIPEGLRLLSVAVSLFGPRKIVQELFYYNEGQCSSFSDYRDTELKPECFMQVFKETFIPWCLAGFSSSISNRLDLLLVLLNDECFPEQWSTIISYAIKQGKSGIELGSEESDCLALLAMLLEKARIEIMNRKERHHNYRHWSNPSDWHHELLESSVIAVTCSSSPSRVSAAQFVCSALGGSTQGNGISFLSRDAIVLILKEVHKKLLAFICQSPFNSVRDSGFLLTAEANNFSVDNKISSDVIKMAQFALDILKGSLYCLQAISEETGLVSDILASVYIMHWQHSMEETIDEVLDENSKNKIEGWSELGESLHGFYCKINEEFWTSFSSDILRRLGSILVQFVRSVIFKEPMLNANRITSLCCKWMCEVLSSFCHNEAEEQNLLNQLLIKDENWPLWITQDFCAPVGMPSLDVADVSVSVNASGAQKFVSLVEKLMFKIGINRILAGYVEKETNSELTARVWITAEILCTWQWPGGSALASFLPFLTTCAKGWDFRLQETLLDSIIHILLDGALVHGETGRCCSFSFGPIVAGELHKIEEPFLRALLSLLFTLLKDDIWGEEKARELFGLLVNKLFIGEVINRNCLKILPLIVSVLVRPLCQRRVMPDESEGDIHEDWMQDTVKDWLQRILSFPPLVLWQTGQDMEEWFHLVIACYPRTATGHTKSFKLERNISLEERELILDLFRKQRHSTSGLVSGNKLPVVQLLLSKLMIISVGYCWKEFTEEDWEFFFLQLRSWIQPAVVILEEVTENVNDAINNSSTSKNDDVLRNLKQFVLIPDLAPINVATDALAAFSIFSGVFEIQQPELNDSHPKGVEKWAPTTDRILEGILRLFFCTGISEAIASSYCHEAASIIAKSRLDTPYFWELVASNVVYSSPQARDKAVKSIEFWGLSRGSISSLYAILFSSIPVPPMQFAAYVVLSTEPVSQMAIVQEDAASSSAGNVMGEKNSSMLEVSSERNVHLKDELSHMIENLPYEVLEMDLMAPERVNVYLAWSLLLSHLWSLPSLSAAREQLVQYVQDSASSVILDCLFQHIPLELCTAQSLKKKDADLPAEALEAAEAAKTAISTGSLLFSVEPLWPVTTEKMASLSGALFGLMLRVLPAYVRGWFTDLRDRSASSSIETFTRLWCSPPLIVNELSQIKTANFADENFSVSVSKSANEVVATYTKDETGMDLVIRLPASYPLRPVDVDCMRSLGISEVKQRKWLMSMMLFVRNQNGALAEAIRIWKRNFDKEFEGVEECPICYSVIHTTNHSLPRLACRTCKHKFHAACLYKWFSTSHKSSCPLCQSPF